MNSSTRLDRTLLLPPPRSVMLMDASLRELGDLKSLKGVLGFSSESPVGLSSPVGFSGSITEGSVSSFWSVTLSLMGEEMESLLGIGGPSALRD